jgi:hypothetical protein
MNDQDPTDPKKPGGVKHDSRGNAVWQWAADTGRHAIDSTSRLLKRLDVPGLKIDEDPPKPSAPPPKPGLSIATDDRDRKPRPPDPGGGYDPYGGMGGRATKRPASAGAPKPGATPAVRTPAAVPGPRPSLWQRLTGKR